MKFYLPYSPSLTYNFKCIYDQFGRKVPSSFTDNTEITLIKHFESNVLSLLDSDQQEFNMIELGCNQAYYSCMFYAMCLKFNKIPNLLLVEPNIEHYHRALNTLSINNYSNVVWSHSIVGDIEEISNSLEDSTLPGGKNYLLGNNTVINTLEEIIVEKFNKSIDVLHMDVDFSEWSVLSSSKNLFQDKNFKLIFILTHSEDLHRKCKNFLLSCSYNLVFEETRMIVGYDSLLIFKS